jgi:hypothetical protein
VLATSGGGSLEAAIRRARARTRACVEAGVRRAAARRLTVAGDVGIDGRAAFFAIEVPGPEVVRALYHDGFIADFRAHHPDGGPGLCRISANAASFPYEVEALVDALADGLAQA